MASPNESTFIGGIFSRLAVSLRLRNDSPLNERLEEKRGSVMIGAIENEVYLKILVLGSPAVGKTSVVSRYSRGAFNPTYRPTIGVDVTSLQLPYSQSPFADRHVRLQFWDVAGVELRGAHHRHFVADIDGVLMVFNSFDPATLKSVDEWRHVLLGCGANKVPTMLLAHQCDKELNIHPSELDTYIARCGFLGWRLTTARSGEHGSVKEAIDGLLTAVMQNFRAKRPDRRSCGLATEASAITSPLYPQLGLINFEKDCAQPSELLEGLASSDLRSFPVDQDNLCSLEYQAQDPLFVETSKDDLDPIVFDLNNPEKLRGLMTELAERLSPKELLAMLPKDGCLSFFLPFIERSFYQTHAQLLKLRVAKEKV
eukprot:gnl/Hemi2/28775_TR9538_c0_g1_i1.p1 gnl/Hemi2/28775_TR9538_c0_g1~~gnl/Hemi2/28775_TR9538_c0_g1_i1.p1  ORF type:complete len:370 (-),score=-3.11 gnl/Hemi2/28775_TR9538_c0_g1_i1:100-1209(-)